MKIMHFFQKGLIISLVTRTVALSPKYIKISEAVVKNRGFLLQFLNCFGLVLRSIDKSLFYSDYIFTRSA